MACDDEVNDVACSYANITAWRRTFLDELSNKALLLQKCLCIKVFFWQEQSFESNKTDQKFDPAKSLTIFL